MTHLPVNPVGLQTVELIPWMCVASRLLKPKCSGSLQRKHLHTWTKRTAWLVPSQALPISLPGFTKKPVRQWKLKLKTWLKTIILDCVSPRGSLLASTAGLILHPWPLDADCTPLLSTNLLRPCCPEAQELRLAAGPVMYPSIHPHMHSNACKSCPYFDCDLWLRRCSPSCLIKLSFGGSSSWKLEQASWLRRRPVFDDFPATQLMPRSKNIQETSMLEPTSPETPDKEATRSKCNSFLSTL